MPSPFPGMDPYLEAPSIWPDFHDALASELRRWLNQHLPKPYYARLESRPESEGTDHPLVEIRDPTQGHALVTLIEIASPANKSPGPDRKSYLRKQAEVLASNANLVEFDLLRRGQRLLASPELEAFVGQLATKPDYLAMVNRASERQDGRIAYQVFPIVLANVLPVIPLPLRVGQPELPVDLQHLFQLAYDGGPYVRGAIDYAQPPNPPLRSELQAWARECLQKRGLIP